MTRIVLAMIIALTVTNCTEVLNFSKQFIHKLSIKVINQIEAQMKVTPDFRIYFSLFFYYSKLSFSWSKRSHET